MNRPRGVLVAGVAALVGLVVLADPGAADPGASAVSSGQQSVATAAPLRAITESRSIGTSAKGLPIRAFRLGDPEATTRAVFFASIHGDESGPTKILRNLMSGPAITGADIWVIPVLNPDGVVRQWRQNARKVDLNRNFPIDWRPQTGRYYSGSGPASEPETKALIAFLRQVRPQFVVGLHQPLRGVDNSYPQARPFGQRLARGLDLPLTTFRCNSCHGTMTQWYNATGYGAALTVEYGAAVSNYQANVTGPRGLLYSVGARRAASAG